MLGLFAILAAGASAASLQAAAQNVDPRDAAPPQGSEALIPFANQFPERIAHIISAEGADNFVEIVSNTFHVKLVKRLMNPRDLHEIYTSNPRAPFVIDVNGEEWHRGYSGFFFFWRDAPDSRGVRLPPTCISIHEIDVKLSASGWRLLGKSTWGGGKDGFAVSTKTAYEYIDGTSLNDSKFYIFMLSATAEEDCLDFFVLNGGPMQSPFAPIQSPATDHMRRGT